jgi:uncharacterized iron-regulated protein
MNAEEWLPLLGQRDIIYLGEEHHNRWHIEAATRVLDSLIRGGARPTLALEMIGWDGQPAIDRFLLGRDMEPARFLQELRWDQNWGGDFADYEPLLRFARGRRLSVVALNPPRPLVRRVAKEGLVAALFHDDMATWHMRRETFLDNPGYRHTIQEQIRQCHPGLAAEAYERLYQASLFRDEGMAAVLAARLRQADSGKPIVSYTGGGHIQQGLPVPDRVARRTDLALSAVTVYLTSYTPDRADEIEELSRSVIADFIWLTPVSDHGPPRRCGS